MIRTIEKLEPKAAAGLLARAALSVSAAAPARDLREDDPALTATLFAEVRDKLGLDKGDDSPEAAEKIAAFLDEESDRLIQPPDTAAALQRMAVRGDLPSDLYHIEVIKNVADIYGKYFVEEKKLIDATIKRPDSEQHFGPTRNEGEPPMVSLFQKLFRTKWPFKDFILLVAGQRAELTLHVHQVWRIFPARTNIVGADRPLELLKRFAENFGGDIVIDGEKSSFRLSTVGIDNSTIDMLNLDRAKTTLSRFNQVDPISRKETASLVVGINITKYMSYYRSFRVKESEILQY